MSRRKTFFLYTLELYLIRLNTTLATLNVFIILQFDLFSQSSDSDENDCADSMVIQLVPDTPFEKKEADIHNATEKSETKPI